MLPRDSIVQSTNRIVGERRWFALGAVLVTMFFSSLDQTIVSTALPTIIGDLKGFSIYAWVFTAYMIASTVTVPIYGKLSDVYGRKPFYVLGLALFMLGSALSGQAHSMMELIIFRAFQGIGGGAMLSMPRATIGDIFNPRERGRWMGLIAMTFGVASIIGPLLGGWITDHWGWRWIFYINLPVAAFALLAILYALPRVRAEHRVRVDWLGSGVLVVGLIPLLLAFTWGGSRYAWNSPIIIGLLAFAVVVLGLFVLTERRVSNPIVPMAFFRVPIFATANAIGLLLSMGMFSLLMFLPILIQGVLGLSASNSGVVMTPMMLSFIGGSVTAGLIVTKTGKYKIVAIVAAIIMCVGTFLTSRLGVDSTWAIVVRNMLVVGIGIGGLMPTLNVAIQNAFPYRVLGVVNASQQFVTSLGGIIAAPILGSILANVFASQLQIDLPAKLASLVSGVDPQTLINAQAQAAIESQFSGLGAEGQALYQQVIGAVHHSLARGMQTIFLIALGLAILAFVVCLFLPQIALKRDEFYEAAEGSEGEASSGGLAGDAAILAAAGIVEQSAEAEGGVGGGGGAEGEAAASPREPRRWRRPLLAIAGLLLVLAILGLSIEGVIARHHIRSDLAALEARTEAASSTQEATTTEEQGAEPTAETGQGSSAEEATVALTTSAVGSGAVSPAEGSYRIGDTVAVTAIPDPGWAFQAWSGDAAGTGNPLQLTLEASTSLVATFIPVVCTVTASAGPNGSITPSGATTVDYGKNVTLEITPAPHYHVSEVVADDVSLGAVSNYTLTHVTTDHAISAAFAIDRSTLATSVLGKGSIDPASGTFDYGASVRLTATAAEGSRFVGWGGDASGTANPLDLSMDNDQWVTAVFVSEVYAIEARAEGPGAISPSGGAMVDYGATPTYRMVPAEHAHVGDVLVDGETVGAVTEYTLDPVTSDRTIVAQFAPDEEALELSVDGNGTATADQESYSYGETAVLTAVAEPGWHFSGWTGDATGSQNPLTLTMDRPLSVVATFSLETHTITADAGDHGTIAPAGEVAVGYGTDQVFRVVPSSGYRVADLRVDEESVGRLSRYVFTDVVSDHTIEATFEWDSRVVAASAEGHGTIAPSGDVAVDPGKDLQVTITPEPHYHILDVAVDGDSVGPVTRYLFSDLQGDHTIRASFAADTYTISAGSGPGGSVKPEGSWLVEYGDDLTFRMLPGFGQRVADVKVDGISVGPVRSYTFDSIDADHTLSVTFGEDR